MRINKNEYYMNIAVAVSLRSTCIRRKVGAIIVKDNKILGTGYNGSPKGLPNCCDDNSRCYRTKNNIASGEKLELCYAQHAEINALFNAIKTCCDLEGSSIYVTTFPCSNCAKAIIQTGIKEIYYLDDYNNDFTLNMIHEAGVKEYSMDSSIYRTPKIEGADRYAQNDLDSIDPLINKIYKYEIGTEKFKNNRKEVLSNENIPDEYVLYIKDINWKYKEKFFNIPFRRIYNKRYFKISDKFFFTFDSVDIDDMFTFGVVYRKTAEYGGLMTTNDKTKRHCVVAALLEDKDNNFYLLKSKEGRLKDKYTLIQGHVIDTNDNNIIDKLYSNMIRELHEEVKLTKKHEDIDIIGTIGLNDNEISKDHIGFLYKIIINDNIVESKEPDKHSVVKIPKQSLINDIKYGTGIYNELDTWVKTFISNYYC